MPGQTLKEHRSSYFTK